MHFDDEKAGRYEESVQSQILHLGGKKPLYYYVRTRRELVEVLKQFKASGYRYLHLSCHGSSTSLEMTLDEILFSEFGELARRYLDNKRIFISACRVVNGYLAGQIITRTHCKSIAGPYTSMEFNDAAIIWASFYHLISKMEPNKMTRKTLEVTLQRVVDAFGIRVNRFFRTSKNDYEKESFKGRLNIMRKPNPKTRSRNAT